MNKLTNILLISREEIDIETIHAKVLTLIIKYKVAGFLRLKQFSAPVETLVGAYSDLKKLLSEDEQFSAVILHNSDSSLNESIIAFFQKSFGVEKDNICIFSGLEQNDWQMLKDFIVKWQSKLPETNAEFLAKIAAKEKLFLFD